MKRWLIIALIGVVIIPTSVRANSSQVSQQIDELDCTLTASSNGSGTVVSPGCPAQRPIVGTASPNSGHPIVNGLLDAAFGSNFRVSLDGIWYQHGIDSELTVSGNEWTLDLSGLTSQLLPGTYEVRVEHTLATSEVLVDATSDELVVPIVSIATPTINPTTSTDGLPVLTGTYDASKSQRLRVQVDGVWYELGVDGELQSTGNTWTLDLTGLTSPLAIGQYDVVVEVIASDGRTVTDDSTGELVVQEPAEPRAPTVDSKKWVGGRPVITGTYDSAHTTELRVYVAGRWYVLGVDNQLSVDGDRWRLDLRKVSPELPVGKHDISVQTILKDGEVLSDDTLYELEILPVSIVEIIKHPLANTGGSALLLGMVAIISILAGGSGLLHVRYRRRRIES